MDTRRRSSWLWLGTLVALSTGLARGGAAPQNPRRLKSDPGQEYYVYLPKDFDPARTYWVLVGVHGLGGDGKGALGWESFADEGQCIVVGPSFKDGYQSAGRGSADDMKAILRELAKEYKIQHKIFLTGFSAGAQFAHRFAMDNPMLIVGCAPHSAGSWSTPDVRARMVPFLVTCGSADNQNPDRLAGARRFVSELKQKHFKVESQWFDGVGHSFCKEARDLTKEFYWTVTTGMTAEQRKEAEASLGAADAMMKERKYGEAAAALKKLLASKASNTYAERAAAVIRQIEEAGKKLLAEADEAAKTDAAAAIAALEAMQEGFKGTRVASAAARRLSALKAPDKPEVTPETKTEEPKPPPAKQADASKAERDCRSWLGLARNYIANGKPDLAQIWLEKIVETYPNSEHAATARKMLNAL